MEAKTPGGARTKARKAALDILFQADVRQLPVLDVLAEAQALAEPFVRPYTEQLVRAVAGRQAQIDAIIGRHLPPGWSLGRMPRVDRNLARVAVSELFAGEVDATVVISEAVTLASALSTDESPSFLNGVLGGVRREIAGQDNISPSPRFDKVPEGLLQ